MNLLEVNNLKTYFFDEDKEIPAVDGISFNINEDQQLVRPIVKSLLNKYPEGMDYAQSINQAFCKKKTSTQRLTSNGFNQVES